MAQMQKNENAGIFPKFTKLEIDCLLKIIKNEWKRWDDIITFNESEGDPLVAEDYEYDSIRFGNLMGLLEQYAEQPENFKEVSFGETYTEFLIEALDHEFDLSREGKSTLNLEEISILKKIRETIRDLAVKEYSADILQTAHYKKGKASSE